jgi:tetratricopeptide (TPR) repeat protein
MSLELNLRFADSKHFFVTVDSQSVGPFNFAAKSTRKDREEIRWYLESYAAHYSTEVDDAEARRIDAKLPEWGTTLFKAAFHESAAKHLFRKFHETTDQDRLLTITAEHPAILSLPWELLRNPKGVYLCNENPPISIRRNVAKTTSGLRSLDPQTKPRLRLLFINSRPSDANFIDPRLEAQAVIHAVEQYARGRIEVEFLRPATFRNFADRLSDKSRPSVDIVHFDGHGTFDDKGDFGDRTPNTGYLLFERESGLTQFISPDFWHKTIPNKEISLVILSACQSATITDSNEAGEAEEPMGSVAFALASSGVPVVLAMTHSLLLETAGSLFGEFYHQLAEGKAIGAALDHARMHLMLNPQKHEVQRGSQRMALTVQDWFVPALYQTRRGIRLLNAIPEVTRTAHSGVRIGTAQSVAAKADDGLSTELPALPTAGFFGRARELSDIERWFVAGTRRVSITGFGGQGKTYLAAEAGRWLHRTGMFECVVFVDYEGFQGVDMLGYACAMLGAALGKSLPDANAAATSLRQTPTLVILDNLADPISSQNSASLGQLLNAAKIWSECGHSRLLLTSRAPDFHHADYPVPGNLEHRSLTLAGLGQDDALNYFQQLMTQPPEPKYPPPQRDALLRLFEIVGFHPLSIKLLAAQLKTRPVAELGPRLEGLLVEYGKEKNKSLRASLELALDKLDLRSRQSLLCMGVMQGGATELGLMIVTEWQLRQIQSTGDFGGYNILGEVSIKQSAWNAMLEQLHALGLIAFESIESVKVRYVRFHPSLSPLLWSQVPATEREILMAKHRLWYYQLSSELYNGDLKQSRQARAMARRELPNLMHAAHSALKTGEDWAVRFSHNIGHFLKLFGLSRDAAALTSQTAVWREDGSQGSTPANAPWVFQPSKEETEARERQSARIAQAQQLLQSGDARTAAKIFQEIFEELEEPASLEHCSTLDWLGRCFQDLGQPERAEELYRDALAIADRLELVPGGMAGLIRQRPERIKRQQGMLQTDLGDVLADMGRYPEAQAAYEVALAIMKELGDLSSQATIIGQIGTLAMYRGDLPTAERCHGEALDIYQQLNEPKGQAVSQHQLGMIYQQAGEWATAEEAYRESARIHESLGDLSRAADAWEKLGQVNAFVGKRRASEAWFRKGLEIRLQAGDKAREATTLSSLASLIQHEPNRLAEARELAEQSLSITQSLGVDPSAARIWQPYTVLAEIASRQNLRKEAREYRRRARSAYRDFPGRWDHLKAHEPLIAAIITTVFQPHHRPEAEPVLAAMDEEGRADFAGAIRRILDGERDVEAICESLGVVDSMIVEVILNSIKSPKNIMAFRKNSG